MWVLELGGGSGPGKPKCHRHSCHAPARSSLGLGEAWGPPAPQPGQQHEGRGRRAGEGRRGQRGEEVRRTVWLTSPCPDRQLEQGLASLVGVSHPN